MAEQSKKKSKMVYLLAILFQKTDEEHGLTREEIETELSKYGIEIGRKSFSDDYKELNILSQNLGLNFEIKIEKTNGRSEYRLKNRIFSTGELKILVDIVQAAKPITEKMSQDLIKKIELLGSERSRNELNRHVIVAGRSKTTNDKIFDNADIIYEAIRDHKKLKFKYFNWNIKKEKEYKKDIYMVSPAALVWNHDNYYLLAKDEIHAAALREELKDERKEVSKIELEKKISEESKRHYRVDKMERIELLDEDSTINEEEYRTSQFTQKITGMYEMYDGKRETIRLRGHKNRVGVLIDRFGKNFPIREDVNDPEYFVARIEVYYSAQLLNWLLAIDSIEILGPENVVEDVRKKIDKFSKLYKK